MSSEFWQTAVAALGLVFIIEGIAPFIAPAVWRKYLAAALSMGDSALRLMGLVLMLLGLVLLKLV